MQRFFVFALAAASFALAASIPYQSSSATSSSSSLRTADMDLLTKQKKIFEILMYVSKGMLEGSECYEVARHYDVYANIDHYASREAVMEYLDYWKMYGLKSDALFTYYNPEHRHEMMLLYRLFYFAKDFASFYKTACWARLYCNSGLFSTAFTTAVLYRDDTKYIRLPAIHEIYPNVFFNSKTIRDAHRIMMTRGMHSYGHVEHIGMRQPMTRDLDTVQTYQLYSNMSDTCCSQHSMESRMMYFTEDVGLNSYYYYCRMMMPFWMNTKEYHELPKDMRGDLYFYIHQQLIARYYLERISNGLGEMEDFSWDRMHLPGVYADISFGNGVSMPRRDWWNVVPYYKYLYLEKIKRLESRIMEAIDSGYIIDSMGKQISIMTPDGLNILGNLIEGNYDSYNLKYYGSYDALARETLGANVDVQDKNMYIPSALQLFGSSMRDPAFYRIYEKITQFYLRYKSMLPRYPKSELEYTGVRIENVELDQLVTYYDTKDYLINNAVDVANMQQGMSFNIKTWQYRLNYKPYTYKFTINSDKTTKGVMRIFLGPAVDGEKYDDYAYLLQYYKYFFMLDEFDVSLNEGMNMIKRKSIDSMLFKREYMSGDKYYRMIMKAMQGQEPISLDGRMWGFPEHLLLPKGTPEGMRFKLFCYIGPMETSGKLLELPILGQRMWYGKSLGYPLDRPMYPWLLTLNNVYLKDVYIRNIVDRDVMMSARGSSTMMNYSDVMMSGMRDYNLQGYMRQGMDSHMRDTHGMDMMRDLHTMHY